jgi:hypothetical protein
MREGFRRLTPNASFGAVAFAELKGNFKTGIAERFTAVVLLKNQCRLLFGKQKFCQAILVKMA